MNAAVRVIAERIRAVEHHNEWLNNEVKRLEEILEEKRDEHMDVYRTLCELRDALAKLTEEKP